MIIVNIIDDKFIERTTDTEGKLLHKIGTNEYYNSAYDLISNGYEYEEVDDPNYILPEDSDFGDSDSDIDS